MKVRRMNHWVWGAVAASACCFVTSEAAAYRVLEKNGAPVGWAPGTQLTLELVEGFPEGLTAEAVRSQIVSAMQLWNARTECKAPSLNLVAAGATPLSTPLSGDGRNTIAWIDSNWTGATNAIATAPGVTDLIIGQDETGQYRIREADLYLNVESFRWTAELSAAGFASSQQVQYLKEVVAHELGHVLGLDHPCETSQPSAPDCTNEASFSSSLMYPNPQYVEPRLTEDDLGGLCDLYRQTSLCSSSELTCGVRGAGTVDSSSFALPALQGGKCRAHGDCASFLACLDGTCGFGTFAPGDVCNVNAQCANGACINGGCRANCTEDEPCVYSQQQCDAATSTCGNNLRTIGKKCDEANDCASAQCLIDPGVATYCTKECIGNDECPSGWTCSEMNGLEVCLQRRPSNDGCTLTGEPGSHVWPRTALLLAIGLVGLWIRRAKRTGEN